MKITRIECIPVNVPVPKPHVFSGATIATIYGVVVKMHTDEGITGIAETGDTSVWYLGEGQDSIIHLINNVFGPQILLGEDPFNIEKIVAKMDYACRHNNEAKAVIDFALHDIVGKALGVPVYKLLGGLTIEKIPLEFVLSSAPPRELAKEAIKVLKAGYHSVRFKVAALSEAEDIANLKAVREAVGEDTRVTVDANAGWHYYQALEVLKKMEKYHLGYAEQPLPWWDVQGMARLRKQVRIPIFADESAAELKQVFELIQAEAADGLLIKLQKAGGFLKGQKWVTLAKAAGLPVICGCMLGSGIESAIYAHFAAATEWCSKLDHGFIGPLVRHDILDTTNVDIKDDLAKNVPRYEKGFIYPPEGPGLGVELNEEVVARYIAPGKRPTSLSI